MLVKLQIFAERVAIHRHKTLTISLFSLSLYIYILYIYYIYIIYILYIYYIYIIYIFIYIFNKCAIRVVFSLNFNYVTNFPHNLNVTFIAFHFILITKITFLY